MVMNLSILNYYIFKDSLRFIHPQITYLQDTSNQILFKYALFYNAGEFYKIFNPFKKDSYQISAKIKGDLFPYFLKECMNTAYLHAKEAEKLFCYYIFMSHVIEQQMTPYIEAFSTKKKNKDYVAKTIESYFFNKNEKIRIHKTNLANYFFDSFELNQTDIALIDKPIKRVFGFFCSKNYYLECYNGARFYYDYLSRSTIGIKKPLYALYDFFLNHRKHKRKAKTFLYPKKIDTTILNLTKQSYTSHDTEVNYTLDELYQQILKEVRKACEVLNNYFSYDQNLKSFEKYFNLNFKEKKQN